MAFQENVVGLQDLKNNFAAIAKLVPSRDLAEAVKAGAEVIAEQARENALDQGLLDSGDLIYSIKAIGINQWIAAVRVGVVYGAVHEYGLENQVITDRQRRFFWAKFSETGDDMWKALALSSTYTIPARPYLRPAIDTRKTEAVKRTADFLTAAMIKKLQRTS
jgi:phage gpG-like protein